MNSKEFYEDMKTFAEGLYNKPIGKARTRPTVISRRESTPI
jgi:hypothetical protein